MEILFREDSYFYYIYNDRICVERLTDKMPESYFNVPHLDDTEPLYHYVDNEVDYHYPVYYEHNNRIITKHGYYGTKSINESFVKDYTLVNLKLLEDDTI